MIKMSIHKLENRRDYWFTDSDLTVPSISSIMPRSLIFQLLQAVHANDNKTAVHKGDAGYDPLHKLRPLVTELSKNLKRCYASSVLHSVDESMIPFKAKKSFKQYMPLKPMKRGFKVWVRADPTTGYLSQFEVYRRKESDGGGLGSRVVKKLTEDLVGSECLVVFDNFFASPELLQGLFDDGIYAVSTVRQQRKKLPETLKNKKMSGGNTPTESKEMWLPCSGKIRDW